MLDGGSIPPSSTKKDFMADLMLMLLIIVLHVYWIYGVVTYDWSNFNEDQEQAKKDLF